MTENSAPAHQRLERRLLILVLLTLVLGTTVAMSWLIVGGTRAFQGPDRVLSESWPTIYGSQALLAGLALFLFARRQAWALRPQTLVILVVGAWLGELLALTAGGQLLANELDPEVGWYYWLMGTGGPIQPAAAVTGGIVGLRSRRPRG